MVEESPWDVVIVGGGPAGLSAALVLGRCCRSVLVVDSGLPRNAATRYVHGLLGRDGVERTAFYRDCRRDLVRYPRVAFRKGTVTRTVGRGDLFKVHLEGGATVGCRKLLLATGVIDEQPGIPGVRAYWGKSVFPCPYCDGWEMRGLPLAVYGRGTRGFEMSRGLTAWSRDVTLLTDGPAKLSPERLKQLARNGIEVIAERITALRGVHGMLTGIKFGSGRILARRALFCDLPSAPQSHLAAQIGCKIDAKGWVLTDKYESSCVPGVYVAGNITGDVQLVIVAAAEGTKAAYGINLALTAEEFASRGIRISVPRPTSRSRPFKRAAGRFPARNACVE